MGLGIVKISDNLLMNGHKFPETWKLINIWRGQSGPYVEALISGPEFPEPKKGEAYAQCSVIVHTELVDFDTDNPAPQHRIIYRHEVRVH